MIPSALLLIYVLLIVFLNVGIIKNRKHLSTKIDSANFEDKCISLLIPFHNEEKSLPKLIQSIKAQNLDPAKYEVIWLNDRSSDKSQEIVSVAIKDLTHHSILTIDKLPEGKSGKRNALSQGIKISTGQYLVFTDADCVVAKDWLKKILASLLIPRSTIYGGPVNKISSGLLGVLLKWEQLLNHKITEGFFGIGKPILVFGANWAFKKSLFDESGGYTGAESTLSGDDDLFVQKLNRAGFRGVWDFQNRVFTSGPENWKEWWRQKRRHISAGFKYNYIAKFFYGALHLTNLLILLSPFLFESGVVIFSAKIVFDWLWLNPFKSFSASLTGLFEVIIFQLYTVASNWIVGIVSFLIPSKSW